ncbi:MAG: glycosyltransferase family 2 protein [Bacteroidales bacterium]|nr:glycosyltransferase family 2 protein [Bacteroidales bacterium]
MRFSIIMPLYNKAPYVTKAIGSVLSQTFKDYELVIMDDGSRDDSFKVASDAIERRDRCRIFRQNNAGVSMARNNAVALSQGDYLCFLDADDWWAPTFLEEMNGFINRFPKAGIYGTNYTIINETRNKTRVAPVGVEPGFEEGLINYCQVYSSTLTMPLWTGAVCTSRVVFDEMRGFPKGIRLGEDFLLWLKIALKYDVAFLNKPLAFYNQDVEVANRGVTATGYVPESFMTFHLNQFEEFEKSNPDLKVLLDRLRVYTLLRFRLVNSYRDEVVKEIDKVDFSNVDRKYWFYYHLPYPFIWAYFRIRVLASWILKR